MMTSHVFGYCQSPLRRHKIDTGLQAELLSGFETYVPMLGELLCFPDTYCGLSVLIRSPIVRVGVPVSFFI